jgi:hypothetical protein
MVLFRAGMTDDPAKLAPADPAELRLAISLALQRDGRPGSAMAMT